MYTTSKYCVIEGPHVALGFIEDLQLERYYLYYATNSDMLSRLGKHAQAANAFE